jgi:hypothetical protein
MKKVREKGSIQREGPVQPVWPYPPMGKWRPRWPAWGESMSQPRPRRAAAFGVWTEVMRATDSAVRMRVFPCLPPLRSMRQKRARSAAVVKRPA